MTDRVDGFTKDGPRSLHQGQGAVAWKGAPCWHGAPGKRTSRVSAADQKASTQSRHTSTITVQNRFNRHEQHHVKPPGAMTCRAASEREAWRGMARHGVMAWPGRPWAVMDGHRQRRHVGAAGGEWVSQHELRICAHVHDHASRHTCMHAYRTSTHSSAGRYRGRGTTRTRQRAVKGQLAVDPGRRGGVAKER